MHYSSCAVAVAPLSVEDVAAMARRGTFLGGGKLELAWTLPARRTSIDPSSCASSAWSFISASSVLRSLTKSSSMAADWPSTGAYMSRSRLATPMSVGAKGG